MELLDLQIVVAVADTGSISGAAARLQLGQPAVSMRIKALEQDLGQALFVRGHRGVQPTPAGETLVNGARRTLAELQATRDAVRESHARPRLTITTPSSVAASFLPPVVERLAATVDVSVITDHSPGALTRLLDDSADAAIILGGPTLPGLTATPLQRMPIVAVATPGLGLHGRPLALTELRGQRIAHFSFAAGADDLLARLVAAVGPLRGTVKVSPAEMARYFALRGYITFLPACAVADEFATGRLVRLDLPELPAYTWELALVHRTRKHLPPAVLALRAALDLQG